MRLHDTGIIGPTMGGQQQGRDPSNIATGPTTAVWEREPGPLLASTDPKCPQVYPVSSPLFPCASILAIRPPWQRSERPLRRTARALRLPKPSG